MPRDDAITRAGDQRLAQESPRRRYVGPPQLPLREAVRQALRRYHPALRRRLRRFAATGRPCADLLVSFPAAAALIATAEAGPEATGQAVRAVKEGAPLPEAARALGLPLWLRKLPPEAFGPAPLGKMATGPDFARGIGALTPKDPAQTRMWLDWTLAALRLGGDEFALWIARQPLFDGEPLPAEPLELVAAYAFVSAGAGAAAKDPLLTKPWRPRQPFAQAAFRAAAWLERVVNMRCCVEIAHAGWDAPSRMGNFRFVPLKTASELTAEGDAMGNCLGSYAAAAARGDCLIFSVRRGKNPVADLEIRPRAKPGECFLAQLEGPGNGAAPERVRRAVERWLRQLGPCPLNKSGLLRRGRLDAARWRAEWPAYIAAHPAAGPLWRDAAPDEVIALLEERIKALGEAAQRAQEAARQEAARG